jgi:hypothetical protein
MNADWCSGSKCRRTTICTSLKNDMCIVARSDRMYLLHEYNNFVRSNCAQRNEGKS